MFPRLAPVISSRQENAFALTAILRLDNESLRFSLVKLFFESFDVWW